MLAHIISVGVTSFLVAGEKKSSDVERNSNIDCTLQVKPWCFLRKIFVGGMISSKNWHRNSSMHAASLNGTGIAVNC